MSEWLKETGCKPVGIAYAGSNPAPPINLSARSTRSVSATPPAASQQRLLIRNGIAGEAINDDPIAHGPLEVDPGWLVVVHPESTGPRCTGVREHDHGFVVFCRQ